MSSPELDLENKFEDFLDFILKFRILDFGICNLGFRCKNIG